MANIPQLRTPGVIAAELDEPIGRVLYVLRKLGVQPIGRAGTLRLFDQNAVELVRSEIQRRGVRQAVQQSGVAQ